MIHFMWKVVALLLCVGSVNQATSPKDLGMIQYLQVKMSSTDCTGIEL